LKLQQPGRLGGKVCLLLREPRCLRLAVVVEADNILNIVRNIRNAFAHSSKLISFSHPAVVAELRKASRLALSKKAWKSKGPDVFLYMSLCLHLSSKLIQMYLKRMKSRKHNPSVAEVVKALQANLSPTNDG
jgi:hypothetical protein